ncbi:spermatogenesis-associated protein 46 [Erinaceus europaeus]|uniref:Spermatogenesis-associated protein 46 n=1 Tax=Erinaceus europaeus TaxID=9365 RepID=A0A1S3ADF9_ERIEU|nr:spermatogenesis-associated protein 46 [Erinaceus europaeus]
MSPLQEALFGHRTMMKTGIACLMMSAKFRMFTFWKIRCLWDRSQAGLQRLNMDNFSLLSISGPRLCSSTLSTFPDIMSSRATSLPDIARMAPSMEVCSHAQAPAQHSSSMFRHGVYNAVVSSDCLLGDMPSGEQLRRSCTIYRPWFSPYSYFVCSEKDSQLEMAGSGGGGGPEAAGQGDSWLPEDLAESLCSSSSSSEHASPRDAPLIARPDCISSQDLLVACRWHMAQQSGYKCAACCRMYPTLHSLKSHVRAGFREGFSCRVYYRKLKALWGRDRAWPGDRLAALDYQASN